MGRGRCAASRPRRSGTSRGGWLPARTLVTVTWSLQRTQHGEQPVWAALALAALLGQIGLPGGGFGHGYGSMGDVGEPRPAAAAAVPAAGPQSGRRVHPGRPDRRHAAEPRRARTTTTAQRRTYPDIRLVYWAGGNPFHHHQDLGRLRTRVRPAGHGRGARAVLDRRPPGTPTSCCRPRPRLEREDIGGGRRDTHLIAMHRAADPVGEARDDHAILAGLADRLGLREGVHRGPRRARSGWSTSTTSWRERHPGQGA